MPADTLTPPRFDLGTILHATTDDRYLVIEMYPSGRVSLVRIPPGCEASDFNQRFFHDPLPTDPTHASLTRQ
jgi:hypothetical protein